VSYPEQVKLVYGEPVMMPYDATVKDYERYLSPKTKMIILNNPHNPRGEVLGRADLSYLVDLARANNVFLMVDEAYSDFVAGDGFVSAGALDPSKEHVIICNSISKNFGISGWRLGYCITNPTLTDHILKVNQHVVTCPSTVLQYYVARHFDGILETCRPQIRALAEKREAVRTMMDRLQLHYLPGSSTFYFFVSIAPTKLSSEDFCMQLLRDYHVCTVPGSGYGASCDKFVRVSIGTETLADIETGLRRIRELVDATS